MISRKLMVWSGTLAVAALVIAVLIIPAPAPMSLLPRGPRAKIAMMSSVAPISGEASSMSDRISGSGEPHPLIVAMRKRHALIPVDVLDEASLSSMDVVLLIQPRALTPAEFVALDEYVRRGGRLMLFTDPMLQWESDVALTDPRGPLRTGLMDPLLTHWGLDLALGDEKQTLPDGLLAPSPGRFVKQPKGADEPKDRCDIKAGGLLARCMIGEGQATLIADADLLQPDLLDPTVDYSQTNRRWLRNRFGEILDKPPL